MLGQLVMRLRPGRHLRRVAVGESFDALRSGRGYAAKLGSTRTSSFRPSTRRGAGGMQAEHVEPDALMDAGAVRHAPFPPSAVSWRSEIGTRPFAVSVACRVHRLCWLPTRRSSASGVEVIASSVSPFNEGPTVLTTI